MRGVVFWDFDGTLILPNTSFLDTLSAAFRRFAPSVGREECDSFLKAACSWNHVERIYPDAVGEKWWEELLSRLHSFCDERGVGGAEYESVSAYFRRGVVDFEYVLREGAAEALGRCRRAGFGNCVISNNFPELPEVAERLGIGGLLDGFFIASMFGYEKPRREIFDIALEKTGFAGRQESCLMVGDNPATDILGGKGAGLRTVLVHRAPSENDAARADFVCGRLSEVAALAESL